MSFSVAAALAIGCGRGAPPPGDVVFRWIEDDPEAYLSASEMVAERPGEDILSTGAGDAVRWRGHDAVIRRSAGGGLELERRGADPWVAVEADVDADEVLAVEVDIVNPGPAETQLFWAGRWQRFSMRRRAQPTESSPIPGGGRRVRFELGNHPRWRGRIRALRIDPAPTGSGTVRIAAIRLVRWTVDARRLEKIAAREWKIELGRTAMSARLMRAGSAWERRLVVPDRAILVAHYGVQRQSEGSATFRITAVDENGASVEIFTNTISHKDRWYTATVDLDGFAGRRIGLRLTAEPAPGHDPSRGLPVWGTPEIVAPPSTPGPPNVIVVLVDTLRADRLSCYGHDLETSPHIDAWAETSAVRFANVVAPAPWTLPSHVSIFTGLDALHHGFDSWGAVPEAFDMIAEIFRRNGYTTAAITGGGVLHPALGFAQGFDRFDAWDEPDAAAEVDWVFGAAQRWLHKNHNRRFFLFIHTYETHAPHRRREPHFGRLAEQAGITPSSFEIDLVRKPWNGLIAGGDRFTIRRPGTTGWSSDLSDTELASVGLMYDSAVAVVDARFGELLDRLADLELTDNTIVVLTSDHGEALGEDGRAGHAYLDDYNLMVPLIIASPGLPLGARVVDNQVRLTDLMPTLLDLTGLKGLATPDGRSLVPLMSGEDVDFPSVAWAYAASSNRGLALRAENRLKYIFRDAAWAEVTGLERLHDLVVDPDEDTNLAPHDARLGELRSLVRDQILSQHRGLRMEIRNAGTDPIVGRLTGAFAAHNRVKTAAHGAGDPHWSSGGGAGFTVRQGERMTLLFTRLASSSAGIEVRGAQSDSAVEIPVDLRSLRTPAAIHRIDGHWTLEEGFPGVVETGFVITRAGPPLSVISDGLPVDSDVIDQLEALGYLD